MAEVSRGKSIQVFNSFFEDWEKNIIFYYTGKDSVIGLAHPNYIMKNKDKHKYARVAFYKYNEIGDDDIIVYIKETLDIMTITSPADDTHYNKSSNYKIHFEASGTGGRVKRESIRCTISNCNTVDDDSKFIPEVIVTEDEYQNEENQTKYGIGLWVNISDMNYLLIDVDKSLSANSVPLNREYYPTSYTATYMEDAIKDPDENLINVVDTLTARTLYKAVDSEKYIDLRLKKLEAKNKYEPHQFTQNSLLYNPTHTPTISAQEEIVQATSIIGPSLDRIVVIDPVNKTFHVKVPGVYALQLKNGFYLVQGKSALELNVYKNAEQIREMRISCMLTSNSEGINNPRKVIKNLYSSNVYVVELQPEDEISLKATFMDISGMVLENETIISVTTLQFNVNDSLIDNV